MMNRSFKILSIILLYCEIVYFYSTAYAEEQQIPIPQTAGKLARIDAYQKLRKKISKIQLNPTLKVGEYLAENEKMGEEFKNFLETAEQIGNPRILKQEDGYLHAELDMRIPFNRFKQFISKMQFYRGPGKVPPDVSAVFKMKPVDFIVTGSAVIDQSIGDASQLHSTDNEGSRRLYERSPITGIAGWDKITTVGRLKTEQIALDDARNKLISAIEELSVTKSLTVKDMMTQSNEFRKKVVVYVKTLEPFSVYRYYEAGIIAVDIQVSVQKLIFILEKTRIEVIKNNLALQGTKAFSNPMTKILQWLNIQNLTVTGTATVDSKYYKQQGGQNVLPSKIPAWVYTTLEANGIGFSAPGLRNRTAQLNAATNALTNARSVLREKIYDLKIDPSTTVKDFITKNNKNKIAVDLFLGRAKIISKPEYLDNGGLELTVGIELEDLWNIIHGDKKENAYED